MERKREEKKKGAFCACADFLHLGQIVAKIPAKAHKRASTAGWRGISLSSTILETDVEISSWRGTGVAGQDGKYVNSICKT